MKVINVKVMRGPNYWSKLQAKTNSDEIGSLKNWKNIQPTKIDGFAERDRKIDAFII
jgi:hypothetical protein